MKRPYASDWVVINSALKDKGIVAPLFYSLSLDLYHRNGVSYDQRSAEHNGFVSTGMDLRRAIQAMRGDRI